jgi:hypothetical protein
MNSFGYGVFAERVAEYLVGWGLAEYGESKEEISESLSSLMSSVEASLKEAEERGLNTTKFRGEEYAVVQLLQEKGYLYTSRRMLSEKVLPLVDGVVDHWDEISGMFVNANRHIEAAAQAGMDTGTMERDYGYAEKSWDMLDLGITKWYLDRILNIEIPEAALLPNLPILGLLLLPALLRRSRMVDTGSQGQASKTSWRVVAEFALLHRA